MPPIEPLALATTWAWEVLNTDPGGDGGFISLRHARERQSDANELNYTATMRHQ